MDAENDRFALHAVARNGDVATAQSLLGSNQDRATYKDDDGRYPIHWAASSNSLEIVILLSRQQGFDPDVQDDSGWTPLMIAASRKDGEEILDVLMRHGANLNEKTNSGQTALHFVASKNNVDVARKLLSQTPPASTRARDGRGQLPLHRAAAAGATLMVDLLLGKGSPMNATDTAGYTPLHHAIAEGHGDTAAALLRAGADCTLRDSDGCLAIDLAPDKSVRRFITQMAEREGIEIV